MTARNLPVFLAQRAAVALILLFSFCNVHAAERRVALVIGNSGYQNAPLINPGNDARAVAQVLRESGFTVMERRNLNQAVMRRVIREFGDELAKGGVGLFYYAGHGVQVKGRNYMLPVGSDIQREDEVADQSVDVGLVLEKMATAKNAFNILILDACRNNPFGGSDGLAPMDAPAGTLIAFSTAPGRVAADGTGDNSIYTKHLVAYMREPGLKLEDVFKRARSAVRQESAGRQVPWENTSLEIDFYFKLPDRMALAEQEQERQKAQQAAIEKAVQEALKRRSEETTKDRTQVERQISERVAAERATAERAAAERIAAIEKEAQAAIERAMRGQLQTVTKPETQQPPTLAKPATVVKPQQTIQSKSAAQEPTRVAVAAPPGATRGIGGSAILPMVGDTWTYLFTERDYGNKKESRFVRTVEAVTGTEIRVRTDGGDLLVYNHDGNLVRREYKKGEVRTWEPFLPRFSYPLEPGKTWEQKFVFKRPEREVENDATIAVVGWENITVQAGTFKALKISYVSWYRRKDDNGRGRTAVNVWFAHDVKRWVKLDVLERGNSGIIYTDSTEELIAFNVK